MKNIQNIKNRKVAYTAGLRLLNGGASDSANSGIPDDNKLLKDLLIVLDEVDNILAGDLLNRVVYEVLVSLYNSDLNELVQRVKQLLVQKIASLPSSPDKYTKEDEIIVKTATILGINQFNQDVQIVNESEIKDSLRNIL
jgi:hypothetical protein